ncbi:hypothetical protein ABZZ20_01885 [Streptomyces sp. NPDC006430]|uniref:hypothetical protein n=1 Tax=Streptomyces sp. NPDC006430 TaxID=3154299 RepID=UPI0033A9F170
MRGTGLLRGVLSAVAVGAVLCACTGRGGAPHAAPPTASGHGRLTGTCTVRTETDPIASRFPELGRIGSTTWCGMQPASAGRLAGAPGPTDVRLFGVLRPQDVAAVRAYLDDPSYAFAAAVPQDVPEKIRDVLPTGARWVSSETFDALVTGGHYDGDFYVDAVSGQVVFDCMNPDRKDGPSPAATPG